MAYRKLSIYVDENNKKQLNPSLDVFLQLRSINYSYAECCRGVGISEPTWYAFKNQNKDAVQELEGNYKQKTIKKALLRIFKHAEQFPVINFMVLNRAMMEVDEDS